MSDPEVGRPAGPYVVRLDEPAAADPALVGGKGANLARLVAAGLPVPEGFVVSTVAYRQLVGDPAVRRAIDALADLDPAEAVAVAEAGASLRERIEAREVAPELRSAIEGALAATGGGHDAAYAVRSSATAEDQPEASFAGQQESYLNVSGVDDVIDRVRACMASLFTDRAIAYRARNGVPHEAVALAVVVQRMVEPAVAGVLFTADPSTGSRRVAAIEACRGLGVAVVSGGETVDTVRVDRRTGEVLEYEAGDQRVAVRSRPGGGTESVQLALDEVAARALSGAQVRALVEVGEDVEALFGAPQDVEWALVDGERREAGGDGIVVLQSRPITSLFPLPEPLPADDRLHVYYSVGHAQAFPEAMPPLVRDVWLSYTESALAAFGVRSTSPVGVEAGGRVYVDITPVLRFGAFRSRLPGLLAAVSEPMSAGLEALLRRRGDEFRTAQWRLGTLLALPRTARAAWTGLRVGLRYASTTLDGFVGAFVGEPNPPAYEERMWTDWGREQAAHITDHETPAERVQVALGFFFTRDVVTSVPRTGPLFAALALDSWLRGRFPDAPEAVNAVGRGFPDEVVTRINLGLGDIADVARAHPAVADALRTGASLDELASVDGGETFVRAFDAYLDEFGHRATGELDLSRPRWREDPSGLLATVRANLEHDEPGQHRERLRTLEHEAEAAAERLERRVDVGPLGPVRRRVLRRLLRTYRGYVQTREYPKQGTAYLFAAWREAILDAGEQLVEGGQLARRDDVWFLRQDELLAALDGAPLDVDVDARRATFERHAAMDAPPLLTSEGEAPRGRVDREGVPEGALVGTGGSAGVVEGVARIVRDPSTETVAPGEILVAPSADPGWTPLFLNAAGMVAEVGGRLSHGALVAREYGLPAVVSVPGVTRRIETGQRVRVDGTRGVVELIA